MDSLLSSLSSLTTAVAGPSGWEYASVIIGALGAIGLWILFTFIIKGGEKREPAKEAKGFFLLRGNFALDLAMIVYWYMTLKTLIASFELLSAPYGFWTWLKTVIGQLIWYRFVYEIIKAIVKKNEK
jgi:hypothetical protein